MRTLFILTFFFFIQSELSAQLLSGNDNFTRADTLRGTLSSERDWFDIVYYDLNIKIDPDRKYLEGYNDIYFKVERPEVTMQIDLFENMTVDQIEMDGQSLNYRREFNAVFIELPQKPAIGTIKRLRFHYSGQPLVAKRPPWDGGFDWKKDIEGNHFVGVACQGLGASVWWPNKDHLSDEPDSTRISVAVPKDLMCVSNGNLRSKVEEGSYTRYNWFTSYPINNYNVTVNIGNYAHFDDFHVSGKDTLSLDYYVLPHNLNKAKKQFEQVKPMLRCYETFFGRYPFWNDGFALVETPYLGMEHQSAIAYGNGYKVGYAGMDHSKIGLDFDYIIIHEAGHEYWGNSVSSRDLCDLWIHEGFCTYSEAVYVECMHGYDKGQEYVNAKKQSVSNNGPIAGPCCVNQEGNGDMYNKGMLFLNTLRHVIDDEEIWWALIYGLAQDHKIQTIDAQTVISYFNEKSGMDLSSIFNQYIYHSRIPLLEYKVKQKGANIELQYRWKADVEDFNMPIQFTLDGDSWFDVQPSQEWEKRTIKKATAEKFAFNNKQFYVNLKRLEE